MTIFFDSILIFTQVSKSFNSIVALLRFVTINDQINVWKCKLIFPTDTLQQKIEITDLKPCLSAENTSYNNFGYYCVYIYK